MPIFVSGLALSRRFFREIVRPLLSRTFPVCLLFLLAFLPACSNADEPPTKVHIYLTAPASLSLQPVDLTVMDASAVQKLYHAALKLPQIAGNSSCPNSNYSDVLYHMVFWRGTTQVSSMELCVAGCQRLSVPTESYSHLPDAAFYKLFLDTIHAKVLIPVR